MFCGQELMSKGKGFPCDAMMSRRLDEPRPGRRGTLVIDSETTGLPANVNASPADVHNWPHLVSIAWGLYDRAGRQVSAHAAVVRPHTFRIPDESARIRGRTH